MLAYNSHYGLCLSLAERDMAEVTDKCMLMSGNETGSDDIRASGPPGLVNAFI